MALLPPLSDAQLSPEASAVFDDIRATRKAGYVNDIWRVLAHDPRQLRLTWSQVKEVMAPGGALDPLVKELVYIAVSALNGCGYCLHTHTAAARGKGMTDAMLHELMQVVTLASQTNRLALGYQVELDARYRAGGGPGAAPLDPEPARRGRGGGLTSGSARAGPRADRPPPVRKAARAKARRGGSAPGAGR